jgi:hypothetical protein
VKFTWRHAAHVLALLCIPWVPLWLALPMLLIVGLGEWVHDYYKQSAEALIAAQQRYIEALKARDSGGID